MAILNCAMPAHGMGVVLRTCILRCFEDGICGWPENGKYELILDMKTKGIGPEVLALLRQESMLERVKFGGEWEDVKRLYPEANGGQPTVWVQPGVLWRERRERISSRNGKKVIANFSGQSAWIGSEWAMKAAVARWC